MTHDVFISYSTKDKVIADTVCAKLEENNIRVWIAPRDVPPGSNFAEAIVNAINEMMIKRVSFMVCSSGCYPS